MDIRFTVPGNPVAKGRPRVNRAGWSWTPQKTKDATKVVQEAIEALLEDIHGVFFYSDFGIYCEFFMRLKGHGADVDNLLKLVLDACNGLVWKDDKQVTKWGGEKFLYSEEPRTEVHIWTRKGGG